MTVTRGEGVMSPQKIIRKKCDRRNLFKDDIKTVGAGLAAGVIRRRGDCCRMGGALAALHTHSDIRAAAVVEIIRNAYTRTSSKSDAHALIYHHGQERHLS